MAAAGRGGTGGGEAAGTAAARRALEELCRAYWFPLYAFARRKGNGPAEAEDLTQRFFVHLLENEGLVSVDRSRGRFRSFLLAAFVNFVADQRDKARAVKRGGGRRVVSLDGMSPDAASAEARYAKELTDTMTPERLFERSWAIAVLSQVVQRLKQEYADRGKADLFAALRHNLDGQAAEQSHAEIGVRLGMSEGAVHVQAHRLRRRYRDLLRAEIMQTVDRDELVDEEIRDLLRCL